MSMNSVTARIVAQRLRSEAMTKINATQILPIAMILLDVGAATAQAGAYLKRTSGNTWRPQNDGSAGTDEKA